MEYMDYKNRVLETRLIQALERGRSLFLLGARQTGKTTLAGRIPAALRISLAQPETRIRYEKNPELLRGELEALPRTESLPPLVILDEVQKAPVLLDSIQDLIDRRVARFLLTGSSARKLRRGSSANLLPGRVSVFHLDPLSIKEYQPRSLEEALLDGSLPGIEAVADPQYRESDLSAYVTTYLEEEIRAEAVTRNLGAFARFLELAAAEAGGIINLRSLASDVGVAHTTIAAYYQILEDCLVAERIESLCKSATRRKLTRSDKYLFFDMGVRRTAAREDRRLVPVRLGQLFEQWVGLELLRGIRTGSAAMRLRFWRDPDGPEVDWIVDQNGVYTPIEVKWTDSPGAADTRHLKTFMQEYPTTGSAYVVCRCPRKIRLADGIIALPWQELPSVY
jgi:predicted AAA+ superfamily ATPase